MSSPVTVRADSVPEMPAVCLIGAPADAGAGLRGTRMGPDALRAAGLVRALQGQGHRVIDAGNLVGPEPSVCGDEQALLPVSGIPHHLSEVVAWNRSVFQSVGAALARGELPLVMGGDHSLAIGSVSAVAAHCRRLGKHLRVLWFDAHADANTEFTSPSGNLHGMPVACLLGHGPASLVGWGDTPAALLPAQLALIGIRSIDPQENALIQRLGLEVYDMGYTREHGMRTTLDRALQGLGRDSHLHLSFDVDVLDPLYAPGVGTPVPGGPSFREMQRCMNRIANCARLGSLDLMELNPARDMRSRTAKAVVVLMRELFAQSPRH